MKRFFFTALAVFALLTAVAQQTESTVFFTSDISPESLVKIYEALGRKAHGKVAVKISTGEPGGHNFLQPSLIGRLVDTVNGTIVECNTAYRGRRYDSADSYRAARNHGFTAIAPVDIMDSKGLDTIAVRDTIHIKYNIVGASLPDYDFLINLAHFKGHAMGGFGGVLKNQSIGIASREGKTYIHTAGVTDNPEEIWGHVDNQDGFLESMAAAAQGVADLFGDNILYINVMNNMSVDCDCNGNPAMPEVADVGILASTDPVALDQACVDIIYKIQADAANNPAPLKERIESRHGIHTIEHAEAIGLGSRNYRIVTLD